MLICFNGFYHLEIFRKASVQPCLITGCRSIVGSECSDAPFKSLWVGLVWYYFANAVPLLLLTCSWHIESTPPLSKCTSATWTSQAVIGPIPQNAWRVWKPDKSGSNGIIILHAVVSVCECSPCAILSSIRFLVSLYSSKIFIPNGPMACSFRFHSFYTKREIPKTPQWIIQKSSDTNHDKFWPQLVPTLH